MSLTLVFQYLLSPTFFHGAVMTLLITVSSLIFGLLAGFVLALVNQVKFPPVRFAALFYLWLFRGTPVLF